MSDQNAQSATTTARELKQELASFTAGLKQAAAKLKEESSNIETAKSEIDEELKYTVAGFVKNTLTELQGEGFDKMNNLMQSVPQLGNQSLSFFRAKLVDARDAALTSVNEKMDETVDATSFQEKYAAAQSAQQSAYDKQREANAAVEQARSDQADFRRTKGYTFVELDNKIAAEGGDRLTSDNREQYEPKNIFAKIYRYLTKGSEYREVRKAMKAYGHGKKGKDLFADLAGFKKKDQEVNEAVTTASATYNTSVEALRTAKDVVSTFSNVADKIQSDEQILTKVQDKVASYYNNADFVTALAKEYGEDFPRNVPLMVAKLTTLDKLQEGVDAKTEDINKNVLEVSKHYAKLERAAPHAEVKVNLDDVRKQNRARVQSYDNYASASHGSWERTRSYTPTHTTVYVDNSPSWFEMMLIQDMLRDNRQDRYATTRQESFVPNDMAAYTTDLLGLKEGADNVFELPASVFQTSNAVTDQFRNLGLGNDSGLSTFGRGGDNDKLFSFDISSVLADVGLRRNDSYSDNSGIFGGGNKGGFDISEALNSAAGRSNDNNKSGSFDFSSVLNSSNDTPSRNDSPSFGGFGSSNS